MKRVLSTVLFASLTMFVIGCEHPTDYTKSADRKNGESVAKPSPSPCVITGKTCTPSEYIPPLTIYARNIKTNTTYKIKLKENETYYIMEIPEEGEYVLFFWTDEKDSFGSLYSKAVPCGLRVECTDHSPIMVKARNGTKISDVDICDGFSPESVPKP